MDGGEGMALSGSASYYLNRGGGVGGSSSGSHGIGIGGGGSLNPTGIGLHTPRGFKTLQNPNHSVHSNAVRGGGNMGSTYQLENPSSNYSHGIGMSMAMAPSVSPSETGKKKRGRPRKYTPDGANMQLRLSSMASTQSPGSVTPGGTKKSRGRPPGSGWKQRLAPFGDWMNSTAGLAFTPHIIHAGVGEDIAAKILSFAQQRPRALCILSANGSVSSVTLKQPTSGGSVTYEGRFEILCLSGSYLLAESGGPRNRTGGLSISVCSPDGHVIGGAIGGKLVASSPAQVVVCSFVYGSTKGKGKSEGSDKDDKSSVAKPDDKTSTLLSAASSQDPIGNSRTGGGGWPPVSRQDLRNPLTDIDLTHG